MKSFILLSIVAFAFASRDCPENSHYQSCGTACPLTCGNYRNPPKACVLMCNPGCHCDEGYVKTERSLKSPCVKPENCPAEESVEKNCVDKAEPGRCYAYIPSWYYDPNTQKCQEFIYGGCQGNGNRYETEHECLKHCAGVQASSDICNLSAEVGICRGYFPRYYYNKSTGKCQKFIYGGCGGNENNFETLEECQKTCA